MAGTGCGRDSASDTDPLPGAREERAERSSVATGLPSAADVLRGTWDGEWVEAWRATDLPAGLRLPASVRTPGTLTIDSVADGRASGTWTAVDPDAGREGPAGGRFTAVVSGSGRSLRGGRFTSRGAEVIATAGLGPGCSLIDAEAFHGGVGHGAAAGLFLAARRVFRCEEPGAGSAWTVEARWTFFGRRPPLRTRSPPS